VSIKKWLCVAALLAAALLSGCSMTTVEDLYTPPRRSAEYEKLQEAIDLAMTGKEYSSPLSGENRQTVQMADLTGDGIEEYLVFAKDSTENPMKVLIFAGADRDFSLLQVIECRGSDFDQVEYLEIDNVPGAELVVGRRLSDALPRSLSVYSFAEGTASQLLSVSYTKIVPADLDSDRMTELMVIAPGESDEENAVAALYDWQDGTVTRSLQASMSASADYIKRIMVSRLHNDIPAVYVASSVGDEAIITDVFALRQGRFTNVSFSNDSGTSVQTLRNYYVYADDIDRDGVLELPDLIDMKPVENAWMASNQKLIRWYAMGIDGAEVDKMYTFHNFDGGWYLHLDRFLTPRISVVQKDSSFVFYLWDESYEQADALMSIHTLTGPLGEEEAASQSYYVMHRAEGTVYALKIEALAMELGLLPEVLAESFHLIEMDWKNGET